MTESAGAPVAEDAKDEVDLARAAIYFLVILLAGLLVVFGFLVKHRDQFREAVDYGARSLPAMADQYDKVRGLLKQYKESGADEARKETRTWIEQRAKAANIPGNAVTTEKWQDKPLKDYVENFVPVVVRGQPRDRLIHFAWNVERMSTKMKTIEMKLTRVAPNNAPETDVWDMRVSFGYREPRGAKEGG